MSELHSVLIISSSNKQKINEYKDMGIPNLKVIEGKDYKEVKADAEKVALYKALSAGENVIVDDTILEIDGEEIIDIRWKLKEISEMKNVGVVWRVTLSIKDGDYVYLYKGETVCELVESDKDPNGYHAFDPFLKPKGRNQSFYELYLEGEKENYSPRTKAIKKLLEGKYDIKKPISELPDWVGEYQ